MLKRLHNIRRRTRRFIARFVRSVPAVYMRSTTLYYRGPKYVGYALFWANTRFPSVFSTSTRYSVRGGEKSEGPLRATAEGIYAMLGVTLRSRRRKIAKLFKTSLAARRFSLPDDLSRLSWCIVPLSNIVIRFAYVHVSLSLLVVWGGPAIETLSGLYLNKLAGRYEYPRGIIFPMVEQVARETRGRYFRDHWIGIPVLLHSTRQDRCNTDSPFNTFRHLSLVIVIKKCTKDFPTSIIIPFMIWYARIVKDSRDQLWFVKNYRDKLGTNISCY